MNVFKIDSKPHEHITVGICLSLIGGFLDAYSYLLKGNVFANAQTGNIVLMFISLAEQEYVQSIKYLIPIGTFAFGIFISEVLKIRNRMSDHNRIKIILASEAFLLALIALCGTRLSNYAVNCIISFIAAVQAANFDRIGTNPMATTMITGNLKSSMIQLSKYIHTKEKNFLHSFITYLMLIVSFGIGVVIGAVSIQLFSERSILVCIVLVVISYIIEEIIEKRLN